MLPRRSLLTVVVVVMTSSSSVSSSVSGFSTAKWTDRWRPALVLVRVLERLRYSGERTSCSIVDDPSNGAIQVVS